MSAFRRRTPAGSAPAAPGVRTPPYSSPVPLVSTGIPALDDIMSGGGVLSGSLVVFVPCEQTAAASLAEIGAKATPSIGDAAADAYTDLFLSYATAQGLVSRHLTAVAGFDTDAFCKALMGTAGDDTPEQSVVQENERMNIAWRYDQLQRIDAPFQRGDDAFCATFDLTRRIVPSTLSQLGASGVLNRLEGSLEDVSAGLEALAAECQRRAQQGSAPVLRITVRGLGSPLFAESDSAIVRFLMRLRVLLRTLALPETGPAVPCVANVSLSSSLAAGRHSRANLVHRIGHLADGCIGLSAFGATKGLREAFPDYTGALRVFRTPAIGTLTNPSLRSSVLRGMGAGILPGGARAEGGAGGGENNLAFKIKRKRVAIETLHLDIEGGVSERRTKPVKGQPYAPPPQQQPQPPQPQPQPPAAAEAAAAAAATPPTAAPAPATAAKPRRVFALKSLRERGESVAKHDF